MEVYEGAFIFADTGVSGEILAGYSCKGSTAFSETKAGLFQASGPNSVPQMEKKYDLEYRCFDRKNPKSFKPQFLPDFAATKYGFFLFVGEMSTPALESTRTSPETRSSQTDACLPQDMAPPLIFASRPVTRISF